MIAKKKWSRLKLDLEVEERKLNPHAWENQDC